MTTMPNALIPPFLYGTAWKEDRSAALTELALRTGFRGIDTANQRRHYFEAGVGQGLLAAYDAGVVSRKDLFLQTKFTYQRGQDNRLPYDPAASLTLQVTQSITSSLEHLSTDYVDSFVLHGPSSGSRWGESDAEVWESMRKQRDAGRTCLLGVSNVGIHHLEQMHAEASELPAFVQNRCFAHLGWDREVRSFCKKHSITYQGFSLLTANQEVLHHPPLVDVAKMLGVSVAQLIFAFARAVGMLPLTGTSSEEHMKQDLVSLELKLDPALAEAIEKIAG